MSVNLNKEELENYKEKLEDDYKLNFKVKQRKFEVYFCEDGFVELYDIADPAQQGFTFEDKSSLFTFLNRLQDLLESQEG